MSVTLMNGRLPTTHIGSGKYLAYAMLFGAMYFLLTFLCPGVQMSSEGTWPNWMNLVVSMGLATSYVGHRYNSLEKRTTAAQS